MAVHAEKVAVCVGSATGMGAETCIRLAAEGAFIVLGDINVMASEALIETIGKAGGQALFQACDITSEAQVEALMRTAVETYGGVDLMHVNAADLSQAIVLNDKDALNTELAVFDRTLDVGLRGHLLCTRAAIPHMQARGKGSIVYTSSAASKTASSTQFSYYVMKAGLNGLMRHVAHRWGSEGIRANAVCPGYVLTETVRRNMTEMKYESALRRTHSTRLGDPKDISSLVSFLLSDEAEWINGQAVSVDGGSVMHG